MAKKHTKKALFTSVMSLVLCFAMLVGTTFAWFTDSAASGLNTIQSGNLDIALEYHDGIEWKEVNAETTNLFSDAKWEPGHTQVIYLKLINKGTLALKYNLGINIASETPGINVNGEEFKLSDYIYMGVAEGAEPTFTTREEAIAAAKDGTNGLIGAGYAKGGVMTNGQNEEVFLAVVVYMPETVGNEANYIGTNKPVINLGISLVATQHVNEKDSFNEYYDGGANWIDDATIGWYYEGLENDEYVIGSAEDLAGLAAIVNGTARSEVSTYAAEAEETTIQDSFKGKTVTLASNINLNGQSWTPIGNWDNTFEGTFDGQGHTISNLYINNPKGEGVGLFGIAADATIKNINIENVNINAYSMVAGVVGAAYPANISNCHISGDVKIVAEWAYVAGISGYCNYGTQVDRCSVVANDGSLIKSATRNGVGGITAWLLEGDHKVTNCTVKNLNLTGWTNVGGITGFVHYNNTIEGCSVENVTLTKTRADGNPGIGLIAGGWSYSATNAITLSNNTVNFATLNGNRVAYSAYNELYGSEYGGAITTNFVLNNNTINNITNHLKNVAVIKTATELQNALTIGGSNYIVTEDITLSENITVPAGIEVVLDMNGKTISGNFGGTGNQEMFLVNGNLTAKNGFFTMTAAQNQEWSAMSTIFDITDGGVVNLDNVTADNQGGTDMNFVAHLNNWGNATLNVDNSILKATYITVRAFNSGPNMNNITIKNTELFGKYCFWVHNYTSEGKDNTTLNVSIYNNGNTFTNSGSAPVMYGFDDPVYFNAEGKEVVVTRDGLQAKLDAATNGTVITLGADIIGDVTITQKSDVNVTIDGNGKTFAGVMVVDGKSATYTTAGLTIQNVNFKADSISADACIRLGDGTDATRYTCNVTVDSCTFDVPGAVGVKSYTGGDKNLTIRNSTATANAHSLVQAKGIDFVLIDTCTVNSKNGMNFNNSTNVTVDNCTADVKGYAVRFGESSGGTGAAETYSIKNSTLKSANEDGDAVIILRGTADNATLTIENTTLTGTPGITNTATDAKVVQK